MRAAPRDIEARLGVPWRRLRRKMGDQRPERDEAVQQPPGREGGRRRPGDPRRRAALRRSRDRRCGRRQRGLPFSDPCGPPGRGACRPGVVRAGDEGRLGQPAPPPAADHRPVPAGPFASLRRPARGRPPSWRSIARPGRRARHRRSRGGSPRHAWRPSGSHRPEAVGASASPRTTSRGSKGARPRGSDPCEVTAPDGADPLRFVVRVAGPAALVVAKTRRRPSPCARDRRINRPSRERSSLGARLHPGRPGSDGATAKRRGRAQLTRARLRDVSTAGAGEAPSAGAIALNGRGGARSVRPDRAHASMGSRPSINAGVTLVMVMMSLRGTPST